MDRKQSRRRLGLRRLTLRALTADSLSPIAGGADQVTDSLWANSCRKCVLTPACPVGTANCQTDGCDTLWSPSCRKCIY